MSPLRAIEVEISPGELFDKITILQIKHERITDSDRRKKVRLELQALIAARDRCARGARALGVGNGVAGAEREVVGARRRHPRLRTRPGVRRALHLSLVRFINRMIGAPHRSAGSTTCSTRD